MHDISKDVNGVALSDSSTSLSFSFGVSPMLLPIITSERNRHIDFRRVSFSTSLVKSVFFVTRKVLDDRSSPSFVVSEHDMKSRGRFTGTNSRMEDSSKDLYLGCWCRCAAAVGLPLLSQGKQYVLYEELLEFTAPPPAIADEIEN